MSCLKQVQAQSWHHPASNDMQQRSIISQPAVVLTMQRFLQHLAAACSRCFQVHATDDTDAPSLLLIKCTVAAVTMQLSRHGQNCLWSSSRWYRWVGGHKLLIECLVKLWTGQAMKLTTTKEVQAAQVCTDTWRFLQWAIRLSWAHLDCYAYLV